MLGLISIESISAVKQSILLMMQGMIGIFIFMAVFYLLIKTLNYIFKTKMNGEQ